jgi:hypothetical protein
MKFLVGEGVPGFEIIGGCCSDQERKPARQHSESLSGLRISLNIKLRNRTILATSTRIKQHIAPAAAAAQRREVS